MSTQPPINIVPLFGASNNGTPPPQEPSCSDAQQIIDDLLDRAEDFLTDAPAVHVQEWHGDIYISLSAFRAIVIMSPAGELAHTEYIWVIGRPAAGDYLHAMNSNDEATLHLEQLLGEAVQ